MPKPNGVVLYEDRRLVAIATGLSRKSKNEKTGDMIQTWILTRTMDPLRAVVTGKDSRICGDCPLRGNKGQKRACYVRVGDAPLSIWRAYKRGRYPRAWGPETFAGRAIRIGSYGDPVFVPRAVWTRVLQLASSWTGYTHQWRAHPEYRDLLMASVDGPEDAAQALAAGWRYFGAGPVLGKGEIWCPATPEGGSRVQCADCGLCQGTARRGKNIRVMPHGPGRKYIPQAAS